MPKPGQIDYTTFTYVALRQMNVAGSVRNIGDAVPEAAGWKNLSNYLSAGYVAIVNWVDFPAVRKNSITKAQGQKDYTHHRPVDPLGAPAAVPVDEL